MNQTNFNLNSEFVMIQLRRILFGFTLGVALLGMAVLPQQAKAETGIMAGPGLTLLDVPMVGLTAGLYNQSEFISGMEDQFVLLYNNYSGTATKTVSGVSGTVNVTLSSVEIGWYALIKDFMGFDAFGPGIGYGWAETTEEHSASVDLSPFFTATDVHYGSLMLKAQEKVFAFKCEGIATSFGGLIGVEFLCGIGF